MISRIMLQLADIIRTALVNTFKKDGDFPPVIIEEPADKAHGELSSNIALRSAKFLQQPPMDIADILSKVIREDISKSDLAHTIEKVEVKSPGFINFFLKPNAICGIIAEILEKGDDYGRSNFGKKEKIQIEFVSANPTGPLSVAHARQAAVGDSLANILNFIGFDVTKEYYVNDEGNQINILGNSIRLRAYELLGETVDFPDDGYQGEYIKDIARVFLREKNITNLTELKSSVSVEDFASFGVKYLLGIIKEELQEFGVYFDVWSHQSIVASVEKIKDVLSFLDEKGFLKEDEGALWFLSTQFGDDKDRVVKKRDGSYTYLAPDIAYHRDKYERGFNRIINIWGPDHHGYIPRIKAAIQALGHKPDSLIVLIVQLATIYRDGKVVSMSTRRGQYISLREVIDEVGVDAARFFFLMRHINVHLDFDLELAKKQSPENPVYYIQYAHARIHSINKKAKETDIDIKKSGFCNLHEPEEIDLIKKLGSFPEILMFCYDKLDPYPLVGYLQEVASLFHKFYDSHRVISEDIELSSERLGLVNAARIILANGLSLLGINTPEKM